MTPIISNPTIGKENLINPDSLVFSESREVELVGGSVVVVGSIVDVGPVGSR